MNNGTAWQRALFGGTALVSAIGAGAAVAAGPDVETRVEKLEQLTRQQQQVIARQQEEIRALRYWMLENPPDRPTVQHATVRSDDAYGYRQAPETGRTAVAETPPNSQPEVTVPAPSGSPVKSERPEIPAIAGDVGGVLTPKGQLILEPSLEYVRSDVNRAEVTGFTVLPAILIGSLDVTEANRDTTVAAVTARYGVTNRFETEVRLPYVYRNDTTTSRPLGSGASDDVTTSATGYGIGDVEIAGHYQINSGQGGWPYLVANMRVRAPTGKDPFEVSRDNNEREEELPTGSGFWAFQPSVTAIMPTDPAVLFGSVGYTYTPEQSFGDDFGDIDSGDSISASLGMGIALNEKLSLSLGYSHERVEKTKQNGEIAQGSEVLQIGRLRLGGTYRVSDDVSLNVSVGAGLTDDAPDLDLSVRVPVSVDLF